jgi:hypothetical protein
MASQETIPPIRIGVATQGRAGETGVNESVVGGAQQIAKNVGERLPMQDTGILKKLGKVANRKTNVRAGCRAEVAESAYRTSIVNTKSFEAIRFLHALSSKMGVGHKRHGGRTAVGHAIQLKEGIDSMTLRENNGLGVVVNFDA